MMTVTTLTRIPHNFVVLWQRSTVLYVPFSIWPTSCYSFYHWSLWSIRDITRQNLLNDTLFNTIQNIFIFSCNNQKPSLISHSAYTCTYTIGAWSPKSSWPWCSLHATTSYGIYTMICPWPTSLVRKISDYCHWQSILIRPTVMRGVNDTG